MPDSNGTDKLSALSRLVLRDAQKMREKIFEDIEKEYAERMNGQETELLRAASENTSRTHRASRQEANSRMLHAELDAKKKLILKREEIIDSVMNEARERIASFAKSGAYGAWLPEKTKTACRETGAGAKTVYLAESDMSFSGEIEKLADNITVMRQPRMIGGVRVVNTDRNIAADYSFEELIAEQRSKFLRESGLALS